MGNQPSQLNRQTTITLPKGATDNCSSLAVCILRETYKGSNGYDSGIKPQRVTVPDNRENGSVEAKNEGATASGRIGTHIEAVSIYRRVRGRRTGLQLCQAPRTDCGKRATSAVLVPSGTRPVTLLQGVKSLSRWLASSTTNTVRLLTTGVLPCVGTLSQLSVIE